MNLSIATEVENEASHTPALKCGMFFPLLALQPYVRQIAGLPP